MNCDINHVRSQNVASLKKFLIGEMLCFCLHCGISEIEHTFTNSAVGYSLINHFIITFSDLIHSVIGYWLN